MVPRWSTAEAAASRLAACMHERPLDCRWDSSAGRKRNARARWEDGRLGTRALGARSRFWWLAVRY